MSHTNNESDLSKITSTCIKLEFPNLGFHMKFKYCALFVQKSFNASDGYMPIHTRILHIYYETANNSP